MPFSVGDVISDPNGSSVIITGQLCGTHLILANVYGPNWDNAAFFQRLLFSLLD